MDYHPWDFFELLLARIHALPHLLAQREHRRHVELLGAGVRTELHLGQYLVDLPLVESVFEGAHQRAAQELSPVKEHRPHELVKEIQVRDACPALVSDADLNDR